MAKRIEQLCVMVIALLDSGRHRAALAASYEVQRRVRVFCKAEFAAAQAKRKLDMLSHKYWRRLVLKELGGAKALARWRAAMARCKLRAAAGPLKPAEISAWRKTPERMAEDLRQKARLQKCAQSYAAHHPNIIRDPFKMDSRGQFHLPPLPRRCHPRNADADWTTPFNIMDYRYDATPVTKVSGYDAPILVWPAEFEAAERWDYERWQRERRVTIGAREEVEHSAPAPVIPDKRRRLADPGPHTTVAPSGLGPGSSPIIWQGQITPSSGMTGENIVWTHNTQDAANERAT